MYELGLGVVAVEGADGLVEFWFAQAVDIAEVVLAADVLGEWGFIVCMLKNPTHSSWKSCS
jgi:hypothetical protein